MTERLPSLPNLGHLKKQAKDVLRVSDSEARFAPRLTHSMPLSRYGFPSWLSSNSMSSQRENSGARDPLLVDNNNTQQLTTSILDHTPPSRFAKVLPAIPSRAPAPRADRRPPGTCPSSHGHMAVELKLIDGTVTLTQIVVDPAEHQSAMKTAFRPMARIIRVSSAMN